LQKYIVPVRLVCMDGKLIKNRLWELKMSPEELAFKAGCSVATIHSMKNGYAATEKNVFNVAKVLGVTVAALTAVAPIHRRKSA
jgi:hypothetical protein